MASPALTRLRATLLAQPTTRRISPPVATVKRKRGWMEQALCAHGAADVWERIRDCGTDRKRCGSLHCVRCFSRYVDHQTKRVRPLFDRYATEADQRANIRHFTVLFDAFGFDLHSKPYPTLSIDRVKAAREFASNELYALKRRFPSITIVGAFEIEPLDGPTKALRKDATAVDTLLSKGQHRNTGPSLHNVATIAGMQPWADHVVLYHGHFVVDLNGTPDRDFREWCHARWGHKCPSNPVRRGVHIQKLYMNRTIDESMAVLARYPFKTPFHYHVPNNKCGQRIGPFVRYEDAILAAIVVAFIRIGVVGIVRRIGCQ